MKYQEKYGIITKICSFGERMTKMADNHIKFPTPDNNENTDAGAVSPEAAEVFPELGNEELIKAMEAIKTSENQETQKELIEKVLQAKFFAPVSVIDAEGNPLQGNGKIAIPKDAKFNFKLLQNSDGELFFGVFTDIAEFQKWNKEPRINTIVVVFPQIAQLVMQKDHNVKGFVINPMTQNIIFTQDIISNILDAMKKVSEQNAAQQGHPEGGQTVKLMFGKADKVPEAVIEAIKKKLAKTPEVKEAYFCMMRQGDRDHYMFALDIDADNEKCRDIGNSVCNAAKMFLTKYPVMAAPVKSPFGEGARKVGGPFYVKEG